MGLQLIVCPRLLDDLDQAQNVTHRRQALHRVPVPLVHIASLLTVLGRHLENPRVDLRPHLSINDLDMSPDQVVQQQVALDQVRSIGRLAPTKYKVNIQPGLGTRRSRLATVVALNSRTPDHQVGFLLQCISDQKLVVPCLVATKSQAGTVVSLDIDRWTTDRLGKPGQKLQGRGQVPQLVARQLPHAFPQVLGGQSVRNLGHDDNSA